jgi:cell division protein FtsW (lipid II flippase)
MLSSTTDRLESRLLALAGAFVFLFALALTLSPAARLRSWEVAYRWEHWLGVFAWGSMFWVAHRQTARHLPNRDPYLLPVVALLSGWGLLTIWRLDVTFGLRQTAWLVVALLVLVRGLRLPADLRFLRRYKYVWLTGGLLLTALTLVFGAHPLGYGPRLWLGCCGVYFQPSEPLKLLMIVYLAAYLADRLHTSALVPPRAPAPLLPLLAPTLIMIGLALLLLLAQRDLGAASIFLFLYAAIVYVATGRWRVIVASALALGLGGAAAYELFDVVQVRVDAWLDPWADPSGGAYQIIQSLLAVANGGMLGRGPGLGSPGLVPVPHSDFIFAAIAEESGLLGAVGLLALLALLAVRGLRAALYAPDPYRRTLAAGLSAYLAAQSVLIIGGNLRLLPLTGVTLPFVSYGGSSLLVSMLTLLILLHISRRDESLPPPRLAPQPYLRLGAFLMTGLAATGLAVGWWAFGRGPDLLARTDNPRRAISDRYVRRGALVDRGGALLAESSGAPGSFARHILYPPLSPIVGYTHPVYGQAGMEASLDPYLRGLQGNPGLLVWQEHLLYGQPPPGLDVRLSLDLGLQQATDELLAGQRGALVLIQAESGEILVMASAPTFDANLLDQTGEALIADAAAPLLNRAALGQYPAGAAGGPLLLGVAPTQGLPEPSMALDCALPLTDQTLGAAIAAGCQQAAVGLYQQFTVAERADLFHRLGLDAPPSIRLPTAASPLPADADPQALRVSPLQMALAAAALSADGLQPAPRLALAVNTPQAGWVILPPEGAPTQALPPGGAAAAARALALTDFPLWQSVAVANDPAGQPVTWYLGGTLPDFQGAPLAVAVLLEANDPTLAEAIGQTLLKAALQP